MAPTVTMLAVMKARLTGATKGHALLKKKADALTMRFRCADLTQLQSLVCDLPRDHDGPAGRTQRACWADDLARLP